MIRFLISIVTSGVVPIRERCLFEFTMNKTNAQVLRKFNKMQ